MSVQVVKTEHWPGYRLFGIDPAFGDAGWLSLWRYCGCAQDTPRIVASVFFPLGVPAEERMQVMRDLDLLADVAASAAQHS